MSDSATSQTPCPPCPAHFRPSVVSVGLYEDPNEGVQCARGVGREDPGPLSQPLEEPKQGSCQCTASSMGGGGNPGVQKYFLMCNPISPGKQSSCPHLRISAATRTETFCGSLFFVAFSPAPQAPREPGEPGDSPAGPPGRAEVLAGFSH